MKRLQPLDCEQTIHDPKNGDCLHIIETNGEILIRVAGIKVVIDKDGDVYFEGTLLKSDAK